LIAITLGGVYSGVAADPSGNIYISDGDAGVIKLNAQGIVTTVAGNGTEGFSGDGGPATSAQLAGAAGIAIDSAGNLYISDWYNSRVRKVTPQGIISTVAGNGKPGYSGDGGSATSASLYVPTGLAIDSASNLYIADTINNAVRKVTPQGIISTVAGGPFFPTGLAIDSASNLYIADGDRVLKVTPQGAITTVAGNGGRGYSGDGGPATSAPIWYPAGIAVDAAGDLYIVDVANNCIRKVTPQGTISTVAGNGMPGESGDGGPASSAQPGLFSCNELGICDVSPGLFDGIAVAPSGEVYFAADDGIKTLVPVSQSTSGCVYSAYSIGQNTQSVGFGGGNGSVGVLASASSCPWLATSYANWITVNPVGVATGTGIVTYSVAPNPDSASRSGTIGIAGTDFTVNQSGVVCSIGAVPRSVSVAGSGLTGASLTVTSNAPDCTWTAATNAPWILVSGGTTGVGSGTVTYTVGINTGASRTGAITAAGEMVYVNQAAAGASISSLASIGGVVNGASNTPPIAPSSFVTIYGENLADSVLDWSAASINGALPMSLGGVQVVVNGGSAFISYVQPTQVNILTQPDTATGPVEVDVITNHGTVSTTVNMAPTSPALFTYALQGTVYTSALFATDYAYVAAVGAIPGVTSRPANPGDYILLYATGLGNTNPAYPIGRVLTTAYPIANLAQVSVLIGGQPAPVLFAGMVYAGVFQVNIHVPANVPAGNQAVTLSIAGQPSQQNVFLTFGQ
jgi:uncharacterized protein (TIGR03437 family)